MEVEEKGRVAEAKLCGRHIEKRAWRVLAGAAELRIIEGALELKDRGEKRVERVTLCARGRMTARGVAMLCEIIKGRKRCRR